MNSFVFYRLRVFTCVLLLGGSVFAQTKPVVINRIVSRGFYAPSKARTVDVVIVHSVYNSAGGDPYDVNLVLREFNRYRVSAHYIIARDGRIYKLVNEKDVSYHAGKGLLPDGRRRINVCSLGIELINSKADSPTPQQINSLVALVKDIKSRYKINFVLRHSDIAPARKTDPWNMNWDDFMKRI